MRRIAKFGVFELDLESGNLRKSGVRLALQEQPARILSLLVRRPGEVISREEIRQALWPEGTFVDYDHSINTVLNKLRAVLSDSSTAPRYIETLPRRGYRFVAPVEWIETGGSAPAPVPSSLSHRSVRLPLSVAVVAVALLAGWAAFDWRVEGRVQEDWATPVPLTTYPGHELYPALSPDGTRVAFSHSPEDSENYDIYVKTVGSDSYLRLTRDPALETEPVWSADGARVFFLRTLDATRFGIFSVTATGGAETRVGTFFHEEAAYAFHHRCLASHPGRNLLVFSGSPDALETPAPLYGMSLEDGQTWRLTSPPKDVKKDGEPAIAPDGKLAFIRYKPGVFGELYLGALGANGQPASASPVKQLKGSVWSCAWTSDGEELVFFSGPQHANTVWRLRLSPSPTRHQISGPGRKVYMPSVSRNRLAYAQGIFEVNIWRVPVTSGIESVSVPLVTSTALDHLPKFAPDGARISFVSNRSGDQQLWTAAADGSSPRQLTFFEGREVTFHNWSSDGRYIVLQAHSGLDSAIHLVSADGGVPHVLLSQSAGFEMPSLSGDGARLYVVSQRNLYKARMGGRSVIGAPVRIRADAQFPLESPDGHFLYFVRTAGPNSLWRVPVAGGREEKMISSLAIPGNFAVSNHSLAYMIADNDKQGIHLEVLSLTDRKTRRLKSFRRSTEAAWGLAMPADGGSVAYSHIQSLKSDLFLIDHFQ